MLAEYEKENDLLLEEFIEEYFMKYLRGNGNERYNRIVEIYVSSSCNMACAYCYIDRFKDKTYPESLCSDPEVIIKNVGMSIDWLLRNKVKKIGLNIFSGEFFMLPYWSELLSVIFEKIKDTDCIRCVGIPSNMSFILDENKVREVSDWVEKFRGVGSDLWISASIDGPYQEKNRPVRKDSRQVYSDPDYYDKVFAFCAKFSFGFHPMVSAVGIETWVENYKYFLTKIKQYGIDEDPMTLEVRDNNWTDTAVEHYLEFLDYMFTSKYEKFGRDNERMGKFIFKHEGFRSGYNNLSLLYQNGRIGCSIQEQLFIRAGDLAIIPCHRLSYEQFNYGRFLVKNDQIVGVKAGNLAMMAGVLSLNNRLHNSCVDCSIKSFCVKGCLGSQYETNKDPFTVNDSVCKLYKARVAFIIRKMIEVDMLEAIINRADIVPPESREEIIKILERMDK